MNEPVFTLKVRLSSSISLFIFLSICSIAIKFKSNLWIAQSSVYVRKCDCLYFIRIMRQNNQLNCYWNVKWYLWWSVLEWTQWRHRRLILFTQFVWSIIQAERKSIFVIRFQYGSRKMNRVESFHLDGFCRTRNEIFNSSKCSRCKSS